ncbi:hypothetical protein FBU30_000838 [Linnemannia zychae]|nr:hypothetical protein FBU30_000838 [Linnemannia zychae]
MHVQCIDRLSLFALQPTCDARWYYNSRPPALGTCNDSVIFGASTRPLWLETQTWQTDGILIKVFGNSAYATDNLISRLFNQRDAYGDQDDTGLENLIFKDESKVVSPNSGRDGANQESTISRKMECSRGVRRLKHMSGHVMGALYTVAKTM